MTNLAGMIGDRDRSDFVRSLTDYTLQHKAQHWRGTFAEFLEEILPAAPHLVSRTSHQYVWDMLRWKGYRGANSDGDLTPISLFAGELYGIDKALQRVADHAATVRGQGGLVHLPSVTDGVR